MNLKDKLLTIAEKSHSKFFPDEKLKELGYRRKKCKICGRAFWSLDDREICDDHDVYRFIGEKVAKKELNYSEVWEDFSKFLENKGYLPIKRYPVVARWRDDLEFVIASIADFQPWVTKGIIDPPSKKLTVPQFCLRFNDVGNVGFTGRHFTGFVMIGQHAFVAPEEYDINQYFEDLFEWFTKSLGISESEIILHEDVWAGGGNAGTCIEFFVRGLEVANQVYMQFETNGEIKELQKLKVLDMGMGHERVAWLLSGSPTAYEPTFPHTIKYLKSLLRDPCDLSILYQVAPYYNLFDFEKRTIQDFINEISSKVGRDVSKEIKIAGAIYSICDHARTLLIAISDGVIPSNIGGGYNLRLILRRMYNFIEKYFEDLDLYKLFEVVSKDWMEPELENNIQEVVEVVNYEISKYKETKRKASKIIQGIIQSNKKLSSEEILELYTSHGITPELLQDLIPNFELPGDFYSKLEEFRKRSKAKRSEKKIELDVSNFPKTEKTFYEDWRKTEIETTYLGKINDYLIFDKTVFYPTKGGQLHDTGIIIFKDNPKEFAEIVKVIEVDNVILHKTNKNIDWKPGSKVVMRVDKKRREKLVRHHTATHILTGVLRKIYGNHVWQAGAEKTPEKARLDVTHYKLPTEEELKRIEDLANEIVMKGLKVRKYTLRRDEAERKFGFTIYQGGFIPEVNLRIIEIENHDVEACSGLHVDNTLEVGLIKITNVERIADGIIRFEFVAGDNVISYLRDLEFTVSSICKIVNTTKEYAPSAIENLNRDRNQLRKKYNRLVEYILDLLIRDQRLKAKLPLESKEVIPHLMKNKDKLATIHLELEDAIITSEDPKGSYRKIGPFYLVLKRKS